LIEERVATPSTCEPLQTTKGSGETMPMRKFVVTETVETTVPVRREEVRVEREPITDANVEALDGPAISEEEHEVTLRAEEPVVEKERIEADDDAGRR
jgi:uncharacterized protein (TIGR02271 family)